MKNRTLALLASIAVAMGLTTTMRASTVASESFNYSNGNLAGQNGGTGWSDAWASDQGTPTVVSQQANINSSAGTQAERSIPFQGAGTTNWMRFAAQQFTTASAGVTNNTYGGFGLFNGGTELGLIGKAWPGPYRWSVALLNTNTLTTNSTLSPSVVYVRLVEGGFGTNLTVDVWINPTNPASIDTVTPDVSHGFPASGWDTIKLRGGVGVSVTESWKFGAIAIANSLADVAVPPAPVISSQPASITTYPGFAATFSVGAAGAPPLAYKWYFTNGVTTNALADGGRISGSVSNSLTITNLIASDMGGYYCIITNALGSATSSVAILTIQSTPAFSGQVPATPLSIATNTPIGIQIEEGSLLNTNAITLDLDGSPVSATITQDPATLLATVSYQPVSPFAYGSSHTADVKLTDTNGLSFTNTWSFVTGHASLPFTIPGAYTVTQANSPFYLLNNANELWLGQNYQDASPGSHVLYYRFSVNFTYLDSTTGGGIGGANNTFGGLDIYNGGNGINNETLLLGNQWDDFFWSGYDNRDAQPFELNPQTQINSNEWHTIVAKIVFNHGAADNVSVWLDPDFSQSADSQPNAPLTFTMDASFDRAFLRAGDGATSATFSNITFAVLSTDIGFAPSVEPQFQNFVPLDGTTAASPATPIGAQIVVGSVGINTNNITLKLDGTPVTPTFSVSNNIITVSYHPGTAFAAGSSHTAEIDLTDNNSTPYSTSWSFTVDPYPALPITIAGSNQPAISVSGAVDDVILTSQNGCIDGNFGVNSTNALYIRWSMEVDNNNGETGNGLGGLYCGLETYNAGQEVLLVGNNWLSVNWSIFDNDPSNNVDFSPATPVLAGVDDWHTFVEKIQFSSGGNDNVTIWMDPDLTKSEAAQTGTHIILSSEDKSFDSIHLRCGNGSAMATYSNIVLSASSTGVGFAAPAPVLSVHTSAGNIILSWTGSATLLETTNILGPWVTVSSATSPYSEPMTNRETFYRLQQ